MNVIALFPAVLGAVLELAGPGTSHSIRFGPTGNSAVVTATCEQLTAAVSMITPSEAFGGRLDNDAGELSIYLANVLPTCAGAMPTTPCASHASWYPALFVR